MRPVLCSILKCSKCGSEKFPKIDPKDVTKVPLPSCIPNIGKFKEEEDFLRDLIGAISKEHSGVLDVSETDLQAFMDCNGNSTADENAKIVELLCGVDVVSGTISCPGCGETKQIKNGILFYEE